MRIRLLAFFVIVISATNLQAMEGLLLGMFEYGCPVQRALTTGELTAEAVEILLAQKPFVGKTTLEEDGRLLSATLSDVSAETLELSLDSLISLQKVLPTVSAADKIKLKKMKPELEKCVDTAFHMLTRKFLIYISRKAEHYKNIFEAKACTYPFSDLSDIGRVKRGLNYYDNGRLIWAYQNLADLYFLIRHPLDSMHINTFSFESVPGSLTLHVPAQPKKATDLRFMALRDDYDHFVPIWFTVQTGHYSNQIGFFEDGGKRALFVDSAGRVEKHKGILLVDEPNSPLLSLVIYRGWDQNPKKTYISEIFSQSKRDDEGEREIYQFLKPLMSGTEAKRTQYIFLRPGEENFQGLMNVLLNSLSDVLFVMNKLSDITQQASYQSVISELQSIVMSFLTEDSVSRERKEKQKLKTLRSFRGGAPKTVYKDSDAKEIGEIEIEKEDEDSPEEPISQETLEIAPGTTFEIENEDIESDFSDLDSASTSGEVSPVKYSIPRTSRFQMAKPRPVVPAGAGAARSDDGEREKNITMLTKSLLENLPEGKRLNIREYMNLIRGWVGDAGLTYELKRVRTKKGGSHRVLHIPGYDSITIVDPHNTDSVPVGYARDIAEEIAAASLGLRRRQK